MHAATIPSKNAKLVNFGLMFGDRNWDGDLAGFGLGLFGFRKPLHGSFEIGERLDLETAEPADEGKVANAAIDVVTVKDSQALTT